MTGAQKIQRERFEQIEHHRRTLGHDLAYNQNGELKQAAKYCITLDMADWPQGWDTSFAAKIARKTEDDRLAVAGALLAAEIDRLDNEDGFDKFITPTPKP